MTKIEFNLSQIQKLHKHKLLLNATEVSQLLGISERTLTRWVKLGKLTKLPKFKCIEKKRVDKTTVREYQFHILDVANFMSGENYE